MPLRIENGIGRVIGRLGLAEARAMLSEGERAIAAGCTEFDLSEVEHVDSAAISLLLAWRRRALAAGRPLALRGLPPSLQGLIALYGVGELLSA